MIRSINTFGQLDSSNVWKLFRINECKISHSLSFGSIDGNADLPSRDVPLKIYKTSLIHKSLILTLDWNRYIHIYI